MALSGNCSPKYTFKIIDASTSKKENFYFFKPFCAAIQSAKIENLDVKLKGCISLKTNTRRRHILLNALVNNLYLQCFLSSDKFFEKEEKKEIELAIARNLLLYREKLQQISIIDSLQTNPRANDSLTVEQVVALVDAYQLQHKQVRAAIMPFASAVHMAKLTRRMDVLMTYAARWMKDNNQFEAALSYYLEISAQSDKYISARYVAFELAYSGYYNKDSTTPALSAFVSALPCCLDAGGQLIQFSDQKCKVFNGYLCKAAGISDAVNVTPLFTAEQQKLLLQYVLISFVYHSLPSVDQFNTLFQQREARLRKQFSKLPKITSLTSLEDEQFAFNAIWIKTTALVPTLKDDNLSMLFKAVSQDEGEKVMRISWGRPMA